MGPLLPVTAPWYHGWNIIAVGIGIQAITIGLMTYSFTFWVASYQNEFGASINTIMLAASLSHVATAGLSPFCGKILDANAVRPVAIAGLVIFCLGYFLLSVSRSVWHVVLLYSTLLPLGATLAGPLPAQVATVRWFARKRGMALGITSLGASIGGFVFPPIVTLLILSLGWRTTHVALGAIILATLLPIVWLTLREPAAADSEPGEKQSDSDSSDRQMKFPEWTIPQMLRSGTLWVMIFSFVPMLAVYLGYKFNLAPIAADAGIAPQQASLVMAVHAGSAICGKLFFGYMADRTEHHRLIWISGAAILGSLLLPQLSSLYLTLLASFALLGFGAGGFLPLMGTIGASRFGPNSIGRVIGLMGPLMMVGSFGPNIFALMKSGLGSYDPVFQILMLIIIPSMVAARFLGPAAPVYPR